MLLRVLEIDGSLAESKALSSAQRLPLADLEPGLRLWGSASAMAELGRRLPAWVEGEVTFLGSGDFHHLAAALLRRLDRPVTLVHFDNHPDWVRLPPAWHCGSWVNRALELPHIHKVVTLGPCSDDLDWPQLRGGNWPALRCGRLELYPWRHAPSKLLGRPAHIWTELADLPEPEAWLERLFANLPTSDVWVSIDKDVLAPQQAVTNWDQGGMSLEFLESALAILGKNRRILGADVCGEFSPPRFASPWKRLSAWMDHPPQPLANDARNDETNRRLIAAFSKVMGGAA